MFKSYEFTYAGRSSAMYGMMVADVGGQAHGDNAFGNQANIVEKRIPGRVAPLHFGVRYHDEPLTFKIIFASEHYLDRYQMEEVAEWLTGFEEYQWLTVAQPDLANRQYRCLIRNLTPISVGWYPIAFEADIICDCPYAYGPPFKKTVKVEGRSDYRFFNRGSAKVMLRPTVSVQLEDGGTDFKLANATTGAETVLQKLPTGGLLVYLDSENQILRDDRDTYNLYDEDRFNFVFPEFAPGENKLTLTGRGTVTITGRFLYNTGA